MCVCVCVCKQLREFEQMNDRIARHHQICLKEKCCHDTHRNTHRHTHTNTYTSIFKDNVDKS